MPGWGSIEVDTWQTLCHVHVWENTDRKLPSAVWSFRTRLSNVSPKSLPLPRSGQMFGTGLLCSG